MTAAAPDDPRPTQTNADLPEFEIAVVVFTSVRGVDRLDALHIAERAVGGAIRDARSVHRVDPAAPRNRQPLLLCEDHHADRILRIPVKVAEVRELGVACGDGYLMRVSPTRKAYREVHGG